MTPETAAVTAGAAKSVKPMLTITDSRTGKSYELPIHNGTVKAMDLRQIKTGPGDFGIMSYDPAFMNTASCTSRVTYIDGDKGILRYRGYPIEQLAERSSYLEVAYLILYGELPDRERYDAWVHDITHHTFVHENIKDLMAAFRYDAHPMGMLLSTVGALSHVLSRGQGRARSAGAAEAGAPPDRQDPDPGRLRPSPCHGAALRVPGQRALATAATSCR